MDELLEVVYHWARLDGWEEVVRRGRRVSSGVSESRARQAHGNPSVASRSPGGYMAFSAVSSARIDEVSGLQLGFEKLSLHPH